MFLFQNKNVLSYQQLIYFICSITFFPKFLENQIQIFMTPHSSHVNITYLL